MPVKGEYGQSSAGNFKVVDTIAVPHPYCITSKHVEVAADTFGGMLHEEAIEAAESRGAKCGICRGRLSYKQHEVALLVECPKALKLEGNEELKAYLMGIVETAKENGYVGFAFKERAE